MIDKVKFYQEIRNQGLFKKLSNAQVDSLDMILNKWDETGYTDKRWLAYMLGTTYHETARQMLPIEEYGKGAGRPYGSKLKRSKQPYTTPNKIYYGRGYVQLTWYENYELMSRLLYNDNRLLVQPELLLDCKVATEVMFEGMTKGSSSFGDFTGKCLEMYFNDTTEDWINARRIINGVRKGETLPDKANEIKEYSLRFLEAIK